PLSSRCLGARALCEVMGSTPETLTSPSCSTKPRIAFSSPTSRAASSSLTAMRERCATRLTVSISTDMRALPEGLARSARLYSPAPVRATLTARGSGEPVVSPSVCLIRHRRRPASCATSGCTGAESPATRPKLPARHATARLASHMSSRRSHRRKMNARPYQEQYADELASDRPAPRTDNQSVRAKYPLLFYNR